MARRKKQNALAGRYPRGRLVRRALHDYFVRLPCREPLDILGSQSLSTDPPIAAVHLVDHDPGDLTHVFTLDRDHCAESLYGVVRLGRVPQHRDEVRCGACHNEQVPDEMAIGDPLRGEKHYTPRVRDAACKEPEQTPRWHTEH